MLLCTYLRCSFLAERHRNAELLQLGIGWARSGSLVMRTAAGLMALACPRMGAVAAIGCDSYRGELRDVNEVSE